MTRNTNTKIPLEENPEADLGRKPYVKGKSYEELGSRDILHGGSDGGTYQGMMRRKVYKYATPEQLQHSQFKKPYMGDEFIEMEHFADDLQYLNFNPWEVSFDLEIPPGETGGTSGGAGGCNIACWVNVNDHEWNADCSELALYFSGEFTDDKPWNNVYPRESSHPLVRGPNVHRFDGIFQSFIVKANNEDYTGIFFQDIQAFCPSSSVDCKADISLIPDCCTLEWDTANSDDTILQSTNPAPCDNETATLVVTGGDGNYTWSLDQTYGGGFSLADATTAVPTNTLVADCAACGYCTITVTSCGISVTGTVRCTDDGAWVETCSETLGSGTGNCLPPADLYGSASAVCNSLLVGGWAVETRGGVKYSERMLQASLSSRGTPYVCSLDACNGSDFYTGKPEYVDFIIWDTSDLVDDVCCTYYSAPNYFRSCFFMQERKTEEWRGVC